MSGHSNHSARGNGPKALLERADHLLVAAQAETDPVERFLTAYLAALRGAAVVIALSAHGTTRRRAGGAWATMTRLAPEFTMWADYFADHSQLRASIMAGVRRPLSSVQADEFCARVIAFLHDVEDHLEATGHATSAARWNGSGFFAGGLTA